MVIILLSDHAISHLHASRLFVAITLYYTYNVAGNFGKFLNLTNWRIFRKSPNLVSTMTNSESATCADRDKVWYIPILCHLPTQLSSGDIKATMLKQR